MLHIAVTIKGLFCSILNQILQIKRYIQNKLFLKVGGQSTLQFKLKLISNKKKKYTASLNNVIEIRIKHWENVLSHF